MPPSHEPSRGAPTGETRAAPRVRSSFPTRRFGLRQLHVLRPQLFGRLRLEIGTQQISAFARFTPALAIFFDLPKQPHAFHRIPQSKVIQIVHLRMPGLNLSALSENLTERPLLRNFLDPLNREEPTLVTAIRLAGDTEEGTGLGEMRREQGYD